MTTPQRLGGRFEVRSPLGRGGMADVYLAHDDVLHRDVAVKVLRDVTRVDRDRFASEARVLAQLSHESIVTLYDASVEDGRPWLALELVEGRALSEVLKDEPIAPRPLAALGAQVAAGLAHAHDRGVVHRDVKPSNVLVTSAGRARLTDFGIARSAGSQDDLTQTGHVVGTAAYLAPEQARGERLTGAADVYALGLLLLESLTGRRCFEGPALEAALARLHQGPVIPTSLPAGWSGLLAAMTALRPADRPSALEVSQRLRSLSTRPDVPVEGAAGATRTVELTLRAPAPAAARSRGALRRWRRTRPALLVAAAVVTAVVASLVLVHGMSQGADDPSPTAPAPTTSRSATPAPEQADVDSPVPTSPTAPTVAPVDGPEQRTTPTPSGPGSEPKGKAEGKAKPKRKGKPKGKDKDKGKGKPKGRP